MASSEKSPRSLPHPVGTGEPIDPVKLRNLMAERGLSRLALANRVTRIAWEQDIRSPHGHLVTCSRDAVSKWLKADTPEGRRPKISSMVALCAALNCTRQELLFEDPLYGISASAVAESLTGNFDPVTDFMRIIPPESLEELSQRGFETFADLAQADADGKLTEISSLAESPLNVIRNELAKAAGFGGGDEEV